MSTIARWSLDGWIEKRAGLRGHTIWTQAKEAQSNCNPTPMASGEAHIAGETRDHLTTTSDSGDDNLFPIRRLELNDYSKSFADLLTHLSSSPPITEAAFSTRFAELQSLGDDHLVLVAEDIRLGRIAAAAAVLVERNFIRRCGNVGHVEDVVVDAAVRGRRLGELLLGRLVECAREMGCYKVILNCTNEVKGFYEKWGFVQMGLYFSSTDWYIGFVLFIASSITFYLFFIIVVALCKTRDHLTTTDAGHGDLFSIRRLELTYYSKGYSDLLTQLSSSSSSRRGLVSTRLAELQKGGKDVTFASQIISITTWSYSLLQFNLPHLNGNKKCFALEVQIVRL